MRRRRGCRLWPHLVGLRGGAGVGGWGAALQCSSAPMDCTPSAQCPCASLHHTRHSSTLFCGAWAAEEPVLWVRLDPAGELLCDIRLMQVHGAGAAAR